ncbi:MAG: type IV pilin-like G/H family protein [Chamaesiphon sp.]
MKPELQAKFLQHLDRKKGDEGFTLIELLVVIIIIGILAAIALPNFLNQSAKAKQSEAKNTISSVDTAQNTYRNEDSFFAGSMSDLALGLPTATANYTYTFVGGVDTTTISAQNTDTGLKGYSGAVSRYANANSRSIISSVICEANGPAASSGTAPTPNSTAAPTCGAGMKNL